MAVRPFWKYASMKVQSENTLISTVFSFGRIRSVSFVPPQSTGTSWYGGDELVGGEYSTVHVRVVPPPQPGRVCAFFAPDVQAPFEFGHGIPFFRQQSPLPAGAPRMT